MCLDNREGVFKPRSRFLAGRIKRVYALSMANVTCRDRGGPRGGLFGRHESTVDNLSTKAHDRDFDDAAARTKQRPLNEIIIRPNVCVAFRFEPRKNESRTACRANSTPTCTGIKPSASAMYIRTYMSHFRSEMDLRGFVSIFFAAKRDRPFAPFVRPLRDV